MATQTEAALEQELINNLVSNLDYEPAYLITNEDEMVQNLRLQLEMFNSGIDSATKALSNSAGAQGTEFRFTDNEWTAALNYLTKGKVFDKAQKLRQGWTLRRDDGSMRNIHFIDMNDPLHNTFQVTHQIEMDAKYQNRYDVTILINGLPLVHIELKKRGIELKEAFNQVNRYRRHTFSSGRGLFEYVQMFIVSNGANTKYYSNTVGYAHSEKSQSFKFTNFWANEDNQIISELAEFAKAFLNRVHLTNMITKYSVLNTQKQLMILRPYQIYAIDKIMNRADVKGVSGKKGGYIWHTTGSGKTLTSFKASQLLAQKSGIEKVIFVVDRNDLDAKTIRQFNEYRENSVDTTDSTKALVKQFGDPECKLIVTTIQKLGNAIGRKNHKKNMENLKDKRLVFIFDECHRSQFGETHQKITNFFNNYQLFGFTGTPIFEKNAAKGITGKKQTTKDLFGESLHKYVITDAIRDENVLRFAVEQLKTYKIGNSSLESDINVEDIDRPEVMESDQRIKTIAKWLVDNHNRKTYNRSFNAILAAPSVEVAIKYMNSFNSIQHDLKIATVFSYGVNENDKNADSDLGDIESATEVDEDGPINEHSRDALERYIEQYNLQFGTNFSTTQQGGFKAYQLDISRKLEHTEIDILVVVNMFLTGFDAPKLNTFYVDKNLRYHGLIQAYSRTNRVLNEKKSHGNIVCFRNLKARQDEALELFANKNANEEIFEKPLEDILSEFESQVKRLLEITPNPQSVDNLADENAEREFVQIFRRLLKLKNSLETYVDFDINNSIDEQVLANFQSKYLDLYERSKNPAETVSILNDIDFEIELTYKADIDVYYILRLLREVVDAKSTNYGNKILEKVRTQLNSSNELRSKRELIEEFIKNELPDIRDSCIVQDKYEEFLRDKFEASIIQFSNENNLYENKLRNLIQEYQFSHRMPLDAVLRSSLKVQPSILKLDSVLNRIKTGLQKMFAAFVE
ncbi:MAG: type I restriction endonuclease subunit R [Candidatus Ancillula sp.]|jgi:type I restriction enzyme R subunit|nr:type I restriction endonuclease subunit R [Candidatus Ancillula sp.]